VRILRSTRHRWRFLPTVASIVLLGLALPSTVASASQRPDSVPAVSASAHGTSAQPLGASRTSSTRASLDADTWDFWDYYDTLIQCTLVGQGFIGTLYGDGVVIDYECLYNGDPPPLGPYELWLEVAPATCPAATNITPARVAPGVECSSPRLGSSQAA
jgi:hypothetical protein